MFKKIMNITFTKFGIGITLFVLVLASVLFYGIYSIATEPSDIEKITADSSINSELISLNSCSERAEVLTSIAQRNLNRNPSISLAASNLAIIYFTSCNDNPSVASPTPEVSP